MTTRSPQLYDKYELYLITLKGCGWVVYRIKREPDSGSLSCELQRHFHCSCRVERELAGAKAKLLDQRQTDTLTTATTFCR